MNKEDNKNSIKMFNYLIKMFYDIKIKNVQTKKDCWNMKCILNVKH